MKQRLQRMVHRMQTVLGYSEIETQMNQFQQAFQQTSREVFQTTQIMQTTLQLQYQHWARTHATLPLLRDTGFSVYSANNEDGLLLYLFALIGTTNQFCVDLAFGVPQGANTTNLLCHRGWTGLLIEASEEQVRQSRQFFRSHPMTWAYPPQILCEWVTSENINALLQANGVTGEIDLLSLDVDSIDYWLWHALDVIQPRVVIVEYMGYWGAENAVTVPNNPAFFQTHAPQDDYSYQGASLPAFVKLAHQKGYRLIGCNQLGNNALFIQQHLGTEYFPTVDAESCCHQPRNIHRMKTILPKAMQYEWENV